MPACYAGNDADGSPIYVGRAFHEGDMLPAKIIPSKQACYVPYNGMEVFKHHFEYLCGNGFTWVGSSNGHVPTGAVLAGNTSSGEELFIGRAHHQGALTPGKIHRTHGCMYLPFNGREESSVHYEVLVSQQRAQWVHTSAHAPLPVGAIFVGNDADGSPMYVGRCFHNADHLPAKVIPSKNVAYGECLVMSFDDNLIFSVFSVFRWPRNPKVFLRSAVQRKCPMGSIFARTCATKRSSRWKNKLRRNSIHRACLAWRCIDSRKDSSFAQKSLHSI